MNDMRIAERDVDSMESKITARGVQVFYGQNHARRWEKEKAKYSAVYQ